MDLEKLINELKVERDGLLAAIDALERLAAGGKRRGRPPKWLARVRTLPQSLDGDYEEPKRSGRK